MYGNLAEKDATEVLEVLQKNGVEYRVDETTGSILVPAGKVKELRMQLAAAGLPNSTGMGFELLQKDMGFGASRVIERARYLQAMQGELARTIATIGAIQSARVHLAIPKQSVFVRDRKKPSAAVTVKLLAGRTLDPGQVRAIVHLVASSVPELEPARVTVVDHRGKLLSGDQADDDIERSSSHFEYTRKVEEHLRRRIEDLLVPIVGKDQVRAQVTADIDFTVTEQTQERYNPDQPALRSEQINEQQRSSGAPQGIPGALSNQPPAAGTAPETAQGQGAGGTSSLVDTTRQATRNYELDRIVSHTRQAPAVLRRLSVAVVVDDVVTTGPDGKVTRRERTPEEIERITQLVREAIGFDARRGDSVKVINSPFLAPEPVEDLPEPPLWEQAWFLDLVKQVGGLLLVLLLVFGVLRPTLKRLTSPPESTELALAGAGAEGVAAGPEGAVVSGPLGPDGQPLEGHGEGGLALGKSGEPIKLPGGGEYENIMEAARKLVDEDPKRVAQLVKIWIAEDAS
ncbi:flagellar basal-body MS-ring/collar protein FliF [endosymbiont of unidentified scaly snail isolate Monju]|uniref:flagellar basal-body MS-ring/collar protein FliF n=1 Tax=endosymbiont of unidentified scaly snail isolate Monju TaxID=1248727 RepID=UPI0003892A25|nr:flagellar basal-body MS-ring/collar protein FliF [endosymbiont of unidentified scaly snail isolate Monju]BAN68949.1 flagellar M-ring protein FliF [endosymbiont of unidentified scaly snail isolate Monju]